MSDAPRSAPRAAGSSPSPGTSPSTAPAPGRGTGTPRGGRSHRIRVARILLAAYIVALVLIAFWPEPVDKGAGGLLDAITRLIPVLTYPRIEFLANIVLFVPLGWLLGVLLTRTPSLVLPIAFVTTVTIECGQALMLAQRTPSLYDIVANTAGACVGMLIATVVARWRPYARPPAAATTTPSTTPTG